MKMRTQMKIQSQLSKVSTTIQKNQLLHKLDLLSRRYFTIFLNEVSSNCKHIFENKKIKHMSNKVSHRLCSCFWKRKKEGKKEKAGEGNVGGKGEQELNAGFQF